MRGDAFVARGVGVIRELGLPSRGPVGGRRLVDRNAGEGGQARQSERRQPAGSKLLLEATQACGIVALLKE